MRKSSALIASLIGGVNTPYLRTRRRKFHPMQRTIEIVPYDERWPAAFHLLGDSLREALGEIAVRIDHIGSTSVPGLAAKDIIDVQVTVRELDGLAIAALLAPHGYTLREDITGDHIPPGDVREPAEWSKLYFRAPETQRPMHLHVRQAGRANQRYPLLFPRLSARHARRR